MHPLMQVLPCASNFRVTGSAARIGRKRQVVVKCLVTGIGAQ